MENALKLESLNDQQVFAVTDKDGMPHYKQYTNSPIGRAELAAELPEDIVVQVIAVWGDTPLFRADDRHGADTIPYV